MTDDEKACCKSCRYVGRLKLDENRFALECRIDPVQIVTTWWGGVRSMWPPTYHDGWCGRWRPHDDKESAEFQNLTTREAYDE